MCGMFVVTRVDHRKIAGLACFSTCFCCTRGRWHLMILAWSEVVERDVSQRVRDVLIYSLTVFFFGFFFIYLTCYLNNKSVNHSVPGL